MMELTELLFYFSFLTEDSSERCLIFPPLRRTAGLQCEQFRIWKIIGVYQELSTLLFPDNENYTGTYCHTDPDRKDQVCGLKL